MALDPITGSILGGAVGSAIGGFLRTLLAGTRLDPRVASALEQLGAGLSSLTQTLQRHMEEDKELSRRVDELSGPSMAVGGK